MNTIALSFKLLFILTVYWAVPNQTDSTPLITSDATVITDPECQRIVAVPQNLIYSGAVSYGDSLFIDCKCPLQGVWYVHDVMNKRYNYCSIIDCLVEEGEMGLYSGTIYF